MPPEILPKWFRVIKKIAAQLVIGFSVAYMVITKVVDIEEKYKEVIKMVIVAGWMPSLVLAGANAADYIKYNKRDT